MRSIFAIIILALLANVALAQGIETEKDKLSYSVGWDIGNDIKRRGAEFNVESVITAIRDSVAERDPQRLAVLVHGIADHRHPERRTGRHGGNDRGGRIGGVVVRSGRRRAVGCREVEGHVQRRGIRKRHREQGVRGAAVSFHDRRI